jgi:hypothetical protein
MTHSYQFWFYQAVRKFVKIETGSVPENSEKSHVLKRLFAREHSVDFLNVKACGPYTGYCV